VSGAWSSVMDLSVSVKLIMVGPFVDRSVWFGDFIVVARFRRVKRARRGLEPRRLPVGLARQNLTNRMRRMLSCTTASKRPPYSSATRSEVRYLPLLTLCAQGRTDFSAMP